MPHARAPETLDAARFPRERSAAVSIRTSSSGAPPATAKVERASVWLPGTARWHGPRSSAPAPMTRADGPRSNRGSRCAVRRRESVEVDASTTSGQPPGALTRSGRVSAAQQRHAGFLDAPFESAGGRGDFGFGEPNAGTRRRAEQQPKSRLSPREQPRATRPALEGRGAARTQPASTHVPRSQRPGSRRQASSSAPLRRAAVRHGLSPRARAGERRALVRSGSGTGRAPPSG